MVSRMTRLLVLLCGPEARGCTCSLERTWGGSICLHSVEVLEGFR